MEYTDAEKKAAIEVLKEYINVSVTTYISKKLTAWGYTQSNAAPVLAWKLPNGTVLSAYLDYVKSAYTGDWRGPTTDMLPEALGLMTVDKLVSDPKYQAYRQLAVDPVIINALGYVKTAFIDVFAAPKIKSGIAKKLYYAYKFLVYRRQIPNNGWDWDLNYLWKQTRPAQLILVDKIFAEMNKDLIAAAIEGLLKTVTFQQLTDAHFMVDPIFYGQNSGQMYSEVLLNMPAKDYGAIPVVRQVIDYVQGFLVMIKFPGFYDLVSRVQQDIPYVEYYLGDPAMKGYHFGSEKFTHTYTIIDELTHAPTWDWTEHVWFFALNKLTPEQIDLAQAGKGVGVEEFIYVMAMPLLLPLQIAYDVLTGKSPMQTVNDAIKRFQDMQNVRSGNAEPPAPASGSTPPPATMDFKPILIGAALVILAVTQ